MKRIEKLPPPLRSQVVEEIRAAITGGHFRPGERLVERSLCDSIGVSRTVVREALRQLEAEGLIVIAPNRGPTVVTVSPAEAESLYQVRAVLEALAAQLFAGRATDAQRGRLSKSFREFSDACETGDHERAGRIKREFYRVLFDGSQNTELQQQIGQLLAKVSLLRAATLAQPGRLQESRAEIERLVDALLRGDAEASWRLAREHVDKAASVLQRALAAPTPAPRIVLAISQEKKEP